MAPKKKADDTRSPLEITVDATTERLKACEAQVNDFRDALNELTVHAIKIKQLETEIVPKENEQKAIQASYAKLIDSASSLKTKLKGEEEAANVRAASRFGGDRNSPPPLSAEEQADRDAMRQLQSIVRESLAALVTPYFSKSSTVMEIAAETSKEQPAAAAEVAPPPAPLRGKAKLELKTDKVDLELLCPPGVDSAFFNEVLKMRLSRLANERTLNELQRNLNESRQIVARRREQGVSKASLRKAERQLAALQKELKDLMRQKDEEELVQRRSITTPSMEKGRKSTAGIKK